MNRIQVYFDELWEESKRNLLKGKVTPVKFVDGKYVDVDYILTTVVILKDQKKSPIGKIMEIQRELASVDPLHYYYPIESLHMTLIGCTQRYKDLSFFSKRRVNKILGLCSRVFKPEIGSMMMEMRGINVAGSSIFIQVFPNDDKFEKLVKELIMLLKENGEKPLEFPRIRYAHVSIAKLTHNDTSKLKLLVEKIDELRSIQIGKLMVDNIDLVITDRLMLIPNTIFVQKFFIEK